MSLLYEDTEGYFISHEKYISDIYSKHGNATIQFNKHLFEIWKPYKVERNTTNIDPEANLIKEQYKKFKETLIEKNLFYSEVKNENNSTAIEAANTIYCKSKEDLITNASGGNIGEPITKQLNNSLYLFPENCTFYSKDVKEIEEHLLEKKFDLILLDPPWWNRYIRRKRKHSTHSSYNMMFNEDLKKIPVENLLRENGLVVIWCTNAAQHFNTLINDIFTKWQLNYVCVWFWLKVTKTGQPVYSFNKPLGKQPYEKIVIACHKSRKINIVDKKLVVSVPSAIHSHKPPLTEVLKPYLPPNHSSLEIFARYLLPNFTSYGNEVLRFQHECLYDFVQK